MGVKGLDKVLGNLNKEISKIDGRSIRGLVKAGLFVRRESQKEVPVDKGFLKASAYTQTTEKPGRTVVEIGYTAAYAPFVHEAPMKLKGTPRKKPSKGKYWDPQGKGKNQFLRDPLVENENKILKIIERDAKIK